MILGHTDFRMKLMEGGSTPSVGDAFPTWMGCDLPTSQGLAIDRTAMSSEPPKRLVPASLIFVSPE